MVRRDDDVMIDGSEDERTEHRCEQQPQTKPGIFVEIAAEIPESFPLTRCCALRRVVSVEARGNSVVRIDRER